MFLKYFLQLAFAVSLIVGSSYASADELATTHENLRTALVQKEDGMVSEFISEIRSKAPARGYENFSRLSFELLASAAKEPADSARGAFLVRKAVELSPTDPRVLLTAASAPNTAAKERATYLSQSVAQMLQLPSVVLPIALEVAVLLLTALTLGVLFLCAVQLGVYGPDLVEGAGDSFPRKIWGYAGPAVLLILLSSPIPLGVIPLLIAWSAVLGWFVKSSRWVTAFIGVLILGWASTIQIGEVIKTNLGQAYTVAIDDGVIASYSPENTGVIARQAEREEESPYVWAVLGQSYARDRRFEEAKHAFGKALNTGVQRPDVRASVYLNLATVSIAEGNPKDAVAHIQQALANGASGFDLHYVSAVAAMSNTDLGGYEQHYQAARSADAHRLELLLGAERENHPLFSPLPRAVRYLRTLGLPERTDPVLYQEEQRAGTLVLSVLSGAFPPSHLWYVGGFCLVFGVFLWWRADRPVNRIRRHVRGERSEIISRVWALLPGGLFVAGRNSFIGLVVVSTSLMIGMVLTGLPLHIPVLQMLATPVQFGLWFLLAIILLSATLFSLSEGQRARRTF